MVVVLFACAGGYGELARTEFVWANSGFSLLEAYAVCARYRLIVVCMRQADASCQLHSSTSFRSFRSVGSLLPRAFPTWKVFWLAFLSSARPSIFFDDRDRHSEEFFFQSCLSVRTKRSPSLIL
jgi:hypothetical protein